MGKKLQVIHNYCIHCGTCVRLGYAITKEGKKYIKTDLPKEKWNDAEIKCPAGAIQQIEEDKEESKK